MKNLYSLVKTQLLVLAVVLLAGILLQPRISGSREEWKQLEPGLDLGEFRAPVESVVGDSLIRVLRIDLSHFRLRLLNASAQKEKKGKSVKEWVRSHNLVAGINASMYQKDNLTSVSYMKTGGHVNSSWVSKDKTLLAFDPKVEGLPYAGLFDRDCDDFDRIRKQYRSVIQSIRMVSCRRKNVWMPQEKKWSTSAVGMDSRGRLLFIHVRSPYSTHDLINFLLHLPIDLQRAMYVEGGKDAQLYIRSNNLEYEYVGSYSTGPFQNDDNQIAWPVPNVIAIDRVSHSP